MQKPSYLALLNWLYFKINDWFIRRFTKESLSNISKNPWKHGELVIGKANCDCLVCREAMGKVDREG